MIISLYTITLSKYNLIFTEVKSCYYCKVPALLDHDISHVKVLETQLVDDNGFVKPL